MKQNLHTLLRKAAATLLLSAAGTFPMLPAESETPQSIIHPDWEYTYYNNYFQYCGPYPIYQKCGFTEEKEIDGNTYRLFSLLTETDENGAPQERNIPLAYMREADGKVYMRLHPDTPSATGRYGHRDIYGHKDREMLIYDFSLKVGESYQIGDQESYPSHYSTPNDLELIRWLMEQESESPYSYLLTWDDGKLSVDNIANDEALGRQVWFMHQKCTYPETLYWPSYKHALLDELDTDFDKTHTRTFRFVEGIGCLKSFLPFPGLFLPTYQSDYTSHDRGGIAMLCEIKDKANGETIYKDERRPDKDSAVEEIGTDNADVTPEYYTLQGIRVLNPAPGEICIVRRGAKVTKEVIGR